MVGMGFGFITSTSFLAVCSYFTTKKNRAVSIAMSGTGFGQTMLPQIVNLLMPVYGSRGTILIVGGLALNGLVGALLFQPVEWHLIDVGAPADPLLSSPITDTNKQPTEQKPNFKSRLRNVIDWNLIRDLRFMIFSVGLSCGYTIIMDLLMILPFFLQVSSQCPKPSPRKPVNRKLSLLEISQLGLEQCCILFIFAGCRRRFLTSNFSLCDRQIQNLMSDEFRSKHFCCWHFLFDFSRASELLCDCCCMRICGLF